MGEFEPITRKEIFLNAISEGTGSDLEPITREEMYLSAIAGETQLSEGIEPITREEMFLKKIIDNGGKSGGGGEILLASGTYEKTDSSASLVIPVSFTGTPVCIFVHAPNPIEGESQSFAWVAQYSQHDEIKNIGVTDFGNTITQNASGTLSLTYGRPVLNSAKTTITCQRGSTATPIKNNTYRWYIWGTAD